MSAIYVGIRRWISLTANSADPVDETTANMGLMWVLDHLC